MAETVGRSGRRLKAEVTATLCSTASAATLRDRRLPLQIVPLGSWRRARLKMPIGRRDCAW